MRWKETIISGVHCWVGTAGQIVVHIYLSLAGKYVVDTFIGPRFIGREYREDVRAAMVEITVRSIAA